MLLALKKRINALMNQVREDRGRLTYLVRVMVQVFRQWARDRCPQQAASLAFQTLLSIVPLLAVTLAILRSTGAMQAESSFVDFVATKLLPVSREQIASHLLSWSGNITFESLGLVGLVTTMLLAFVMINSLERIINVIWRAERRRSLAQKFIVFYTIATIAPLLVGTSLYQATRFGLTSGVIGFVLSFVATWLALFFANYFLPAKKLRIRSACVGALMSALLFELAKHAFRIYVTEFALAKFEGVYGAVAIVPLFLLWVYYSWLTMLLGVEFAYAVNSLHTLDRAERRIGACLEQELLQRVNGVVATKILVHIASAYAAGNKSTSRQQLEDQFDLSPGALDHILSRLKSKDLVLEIDSPHEGLLPARPPQTISLDQVLGAFRGEDLAPPIHEDQNSKLNAVFTDLATKQQLQTSNILLADLME